MNSYRYIFSALSFLLLASACTKVTDSPLRTSYQMSNPAGNIIQALDSSACHLFDSAFHRAGMASVLQANYGYTIFAPSDSAMTAAGLTAQVIGSLSPDSLAKIVRFHITAGTYSDTTLTAAQVSVQAATLRQDIATDTVKGDIVFQQNLYLKEVNYDVLYINGDPAASGAHPVSTFNGYLFTIGRVLQAPTKTLWQTIASDPRLDLYCAALRIGDSLILAYMYANDPYPQQPFGCDSCTFSVINYANQEYSYPNMSTIFAPTDSAFYEAGFHTVEDIRAYALRSPIVNLGISANYQYYIMGDEPMDSILYAHVINNPNNSDPNGYLVLYNDLLYSPQLNHGLASSNNYQYFARWFGPSYYQQYPLTFSVQGGVPYVQWNPTGPSVPVPSDPSGHFLTTNGSIYLVNHLFTTPN